jgi:hypothetical protein
MKPTPEPPRTMPTGVVEGPASPAELIEYLHVVLTEDRFDEAEPLVRALAGHLPPRADGQVVSPGSGRMALYQRIYNIADRMDRDMYLPPLSQLPVPAVQLLTHEAIRVAQQIVADLDGN